MSRRVKAAYCRASTSSNENSRTLNSNSGSIARWRCAPILSCRTCSAHQPSARLVRPSTTVSGQYSRNRTGVDSLAAQRRWRLHPVGALDLLPAAVRTRLKDAAGQIAAAHGVSRRDLYEAVLAARS